MAVLIYNYVRLRGFYLPRTAAAPFTDYENMSPWATDAIAALQAAGVFGGRPDGSFAPNDTATRAEVAAVLTNLLQIIN
jgi:hypothetical protein